MWRKSFTACLIASIFVLSNLHDAAASAPTPKIIVQSAVESVLAILRDKTLSMQERRERIRTVIDENFDFVGMSQRVLAQNWRKATPNQQADFVSYFSDYLEQIYIQRIESYTDQEIEYGEEKIRGERADVATFVVTAKNKIPVNYRLRFNPEKQKWFAFDVIVEGQSLVSSYREVFAAIEWSEGIDGVLNDVLRRTKDSRSLSTSSP